MQVQSHLSAAKKERKKKKAITGSHTRCRWTKGGTCGWKSHVLIGDLKVDASISYESLPQQTHRGINHHPEFDPRIFDPQG